MTIGDCKKRSLTVRVCLELRTELSERVWEHLHGHDTKLVEVFIGRLRKKIGMPLVIQTVRHVGYTIRNRRKALAVVSKTRKSKTKDQTYEGED